MQVHSHCQHYLTSPTTPFPEIFAIFKQGHIAMESIVIPGKDNLKAWKFTQETINNIVSTYEEYIRGLSSIPPLKIKNVPFIFALFDWAHQYPFLCIKYFGTELWHWLLKIFVILLVPPIIFIVLHLAFKPVFMFRLNRYFKKRMKASIILPLQFLVLFLVYQYLLVNIMFSRKTLFVCYYILDTAMILLTVWISWILLNFVCNLILIYFEKHKTIQRSKTEITVFIICRILQIVISVVCFFELIKIFGFNSLQILTTMGIGALAIALAGKETIENLLGTILITLEKPFKIGDWILINKIEGTVEHVGLRSTRIRTFYDSYLTIPNAKFITTPIDNMEERKSRRFNTTLNIEYTTSPEKAKAFTEGIQEIIMQTPSTKKKDFHIHMHDFHEESIDILIYMFFNTPDWATELIERERFILNIMKLAIELKIEFAYVKNNRLLLDMKENIEDSIDPNKCETSEQWKNSVKKIVSKLIGSSREKPTR